MNVMDASAILALLLNEDGATLALTAIEEGAQVSSVNLSEVAGRLALNGMPAEVIRQIVEELPLAVIPANAGLAVAAALMSPVAKRFGLSLGDRFCLALAAQINAAAVTADRIWEQAAPALGVSVRLIR